MWAIDKLVSLRNGDELEFESKAWRDIVGVVDEINRILKYQYYYGDSRDSNKAVILEYMKVEDEMPVRFPDAQTGNGRQSLQQNPVVDYLRSTFNFSSQRYADSTVISFRKNGTTHSLDIKTIGGSQYLVDDRGREGWDEICKNDDLTFLYLAGVFHFKEIWINGYRGIDSFPTVTEDNSIIDNTGDNIICMITDRLRADRDEYTVGLCLDGRIVPIGKHISRRIAFKYYYHYSQVLSDFNAFFDSLLAQGIVDESMRPKLMRIAITGDADEGFDDALPTYDRSRPKLSEKQKRSLPETANSYEDEYCSWIIKDSVLRIRGKDRGGWSRIGACYPLMEPGHVAMWWPDEGYDTVVIEEGVTDIGEYAFYYTPIKKISLPSTLKSIEECAFAGCKELHDIMIPDAVTKIAKDAFDLGIVLHAASGSYAEQYAYEQGLLFKATGKCLNQDESKNNSKQSSWKKKEPLSCKEHTIRFIRKHEPADAERIEKLLEYDDCIGFSQYYIECDGFLPLTLEYKDGEYVLYENEPGRYTEEIYSNKSLQAVFLYLIDSVKRNRAQYPQWYPRGKKMPLTKVPEVLPEAPGKLPDNIECIDGRFYLKTSAGRKPKSLEQSVIADKQTGSVQKQSSEAAGSNDTEVIPASPLREETEKNSITEDFRNGIIRLQGFTIKPGLTEEDFIHAFASTPSLGTIYTRHSDFFQGTVSDFTFSQRICAGDVYMKVSGDAQTGQKTSGNWFHINLTPACESEWAEVRYDDCVRFLASLIGEPDFGKKDDRSFVQKAEKKYPWGEIETYLYPDSHDGYTGGIIEISYNATIFHEQAESKDRDGESQENVTDKGAQQPASMLASSIPKTPIDQTDRSDKSESSEQSQGKSLPDNVICVDGRFKLKPSSTRWADTGSTYESKTKLPGNVVCIDGRYHLKSSAEQTAESGSVGVLYSQPGVSQQPPQQKNEPVPVKNDTTVVGNACWSETVQSASSDNSEDNITSGSFVGKYNTSILDSCMNDSWPGIEHPFIRKYQMNESQIKELFERIISNDIPFRRFVESPLQWFNRYASEEVKIDYIGDKLTVIDGDYSYTETPEFIKIEYYYCVIGFFDDSGKEKYSMCGIEEITDLNREETQLTRVSTRSQDVLNNPFGISGLFRVVTARYG